MAILSGLHESEVREALRASEKWRFFRNKSDAKEMAIQNIAMSERHIYYFKAVVECRKVYWNIIPYESTMDIDGPTNGEPISMWSISVASPTGFKFKSKTDEAKYVMPHRSSVGDCPHCSKLGFIPCSMCNATGINKCNRCNGSGSVTQFDDIKSCFSCDGRGRNPCFPCNGIGRIKCPTCAGGGQVKKFQALSVNWKVISEKRVDLEKQMGCLIPERKLKKVTGKQVEYLSPSCDVNNNPLNAHPEDRVREISKTMFEKYEKYDSDCVKSSNETRGKRIVHCQQIVETIPIHEVTTSCNGDMETFFVYGNERKVFYPNGQGCCCSIV